MSHTVVGLFSTMTEANKVKQELLTSGYQSNEVAVMANDEDEEPTTGTATANTKDYTDIGSGGGTGIGEKISSFFRSLSGGDEKTHHHYATGVNSGGALVAVTVPEEEVDEVATLLKQYGAREIEGDHAEFTSGHNGSTENGVIPVIEEELVVGKREIDRGGVRVYSHVVERPVQAEVTLHEEQINVERRPVNRPATAADFASKAGSVIELNATGEEAVVGKTSRVVEEVLVGKRSSEHTESIQDSVRKTEVEIEQIPGETVESGTLVSKDRY